MLVTDSKSDSSDNTLLKFETVTMCPIQTKMLAIDMLTNEEVNSSIF